MVSVEGFGWPEWYAPCSSVGLRMRVGFSGLRAPVEMLDRAGSLPLALLIRRLRGSGVGVYTEELSSLAKPIVNGLLVVVVCMPSLGA